MTLNDHLIERIAADFWALANEQPRYPLDLETLENAAGWALAVEIRRVPGLRIRDVHDWAEHAGISYRFPGRDRRLRGCLIAYQESGVVFLDVADPECEQRFSLAHELAHFLLDYRAPRERAVRALGAGVLAVLDGRRPPTLEERLHAVLADAPLGVLSHLMERPPAGLPPAVVLTVEDRADRLALEILAPAATVLAHLDRADSPAYHNARLAHLRALLASGYGLPPAIAAPYARTLLRRRGGPNVRDWLLGTLD